MSNELYKHYENYHNRPPPEKPRDVGIRFCAIVPDEIVRELVEPFEVQSISRREGEREDYRSNDGASFITVCTYSDEVRLRELIEETAAELREYWDAIHSLYFYHRLQGMYGQYRGTEIEIDFESTNPYKEIERSKAAGEEYIRSVRALAQKKKPVSASKRRR